MISKQKSSLRTLISEQKILKCLRKGSNNRNGNLRCFFSVAAALLSTISNLYIVDSAGPRVGDLGVLRATPDHTTTSAHRIRRAVPTATSTPGLRTRPSYHLHNDE